MSSRKTSRRKFLKDAGMLASASIMANGPLAVLIDSITRGAYGEVLAKAAGVQPRKWIDMRFDLAPPRWVYDLFLQNKIADRANFVSSPNGFFTRYTESGGRYTGGEYHTVELEALGKSPRELCAPMIWGLNVPAAGGGMRPMSDLLQNFMNIRGITTGNPGHSGSQILHFLPLGASQSVSALSGDGSDAAIAAVLYNLQNNSFRSLQSKSPFTVTGDNLVASLLSPFRASGAVTQTRDRERRVRSHIDEVRRALAAEAEAKHQDSAVIHRAMDGARELLNLSFADLDTEWDSLLAKYQSLISRSLNLTVPGINDKPIGISPSTRSGDLRYQLDGMIVMNDNLGTLLNGATVRRMAESFAISEFVITRGFSNSVSVGMGQLANLSLVTTAGGTPRRHTMSPDEHTTGSMVSTLLNTMWALAHASCLLELTDRLKAAGVWSETVINCSGEFNRLPRTDGSGSDHNYEGASAALYSGIIDGPHILGNLAKDPSPTGYKGTVGKGIRQNNDVLDNSQIDLGNLLATTAQLLGVRSPITARETLVLVNGSTLFPRLPPGKIVG